jgi:hypothetical protein
LRTSRSIFALFAFEKLFTSTKTPALEQAGGNFLQKPFPPKLNFPQTGLLIGKNKPEKHPFPYFWSRFRFSVNKNQQILKYLPGLNFRNTETNINLNKIFVPMPKRAGTDE